MGELAPLGIGGSGLLVLAYVIFALLRSNRADRGQANQQIGDAEKRADAAEAREASLRASLSAELESERAARHRAEDREAELAREVKALRGEVKQLREQVQRLQEQLT